MAQDDMEWKDQADLTAEDEQALQEELARDHDTAETPSDELASHDQFHEQIGQLPTDDTASEMAADEPTDEYAADDTWTTSETDKDQSY